MPPAAVGAPAAAAGERTTQRPGRRSSLVLLQSAARRASITLKLGGSHQQPLASRRDSARRRRHEQERRPKTIWDLGWSDAAPLPVGAGLPPPRQQQNRSLTGASPDESPDASFNDGPARHVMERKQSALGSLPGVRQAHLRSAAPPPERPVRGGGGRRSVLFSGGGPGGGSGGGPGHGLGLPPPPSRQHSRMTTGGGGHSGGGHSGGGIGGGTDPKPMMRRAHTASRLTAGAGSGSSIGGAGAAAVPRRSSAIGMVLDFGLARASRVTRSLVGPAANDRFTTTAPDPEEEAKMRRRRRFSEALRAAQLANSVNRNYDDQGRLYMHRYGRMQGDAVDSFSGYHLAANGPRQRTPSRASMVLAADGGGGEPWERGQQHLGYGQQPPSPQQQRQTIGWQGGERSTRIESSGDPMRRLSMAEAIDRVTRIDNPADRLSRMMDIYAAGNDEWDEYAATQPSLWEEQDEMEAEAHGLCESRTPLTQPSRPSDAG